MAVSAELKSRHRLRLNKSNLQNFVQIWTVRVDQCIGFNVGDCMLVSIKATVGR